MISKEEFQRVMKPDANVEIYPEFLGLVDTYYYLSKLIPKHMLFLQKFPDVMVHKNSMGTLLYIPDLNVLNTDKNE